MSQKTLEAGRILAGPPGGAVVMVLVEPQVAGSLRCDDVEMVTSKPVPCGVNETAPAAPVNIRAGHCYHEADSGLVLRCVRSGHGRLKFVRPGSATQAAELVDAPLYFAVDPSLGPIPVVPAQP